MSYAQKDKSIQDAAPIECYEFVANHKTWRYTSYHTRVQVAGQWYEPFVITRTAIKITSVIDSNQTMDFNVSADSEIAQHFGFLRSPRDLKAVVRTVHEGDDYSTQFKIEWTGRFAGFTASGKWGSLKTTSTIQTELNGNISSVYYQKSCNHILYDARCKANRATFTVSASIVKIQDQLVTVNNDGYANNDLVGGIMLNTRTGEQQSIISNINNLIRIGFPFFDLILGDTVELTLGCDHQRLGHCKTRFNNVANYGGFDFIPEVNPFEKLVYSVQTKQKLSEVRKPAPVYVAVNSKSTGPERKTSQNIVNYETIKLNSGGPYRKLNAAGTTKIENSVSEGSGNIPAAVIGSIVSGVMGKKLINNHNLIWTGNLRPVTETTTTEEEVSEENVATNDLPGNIFYNTYTTIAKITTIKTVGYLCDMLISLCLGPNAVLRGITVGGQYVWTGTAGPARTEVTCSTGEHFLSGVKGYFVGGAFNQVKDPLIDVVDFPGHVGIAMILLKDVRIDMAMDQMGFEVGRYPNPLALSNANNRDGDDLNVVSAAVEVMTNGWGYGGLDISKIDTTKFTSMALTAKDEGNFISVKVDNEATITEVLALFQTQADMVIYENPETDKISGEMVRFTTADYVNMPSFSHRRNIDEIRGWKKGGWNNTVEQARALFVDRAALYEMNPVFMQNPANMTASGRGRKTASWSYPFVHSRSLALTLLARDMAKVSAPGYSCQMVANRDAATLLPGQVIMVTYPDYGLLNTPMYVETVAKQDNANRSVIVDLKQVKFPDSRTLLGPGGAVYDPAFDVDPKTPLGARIVSAPYYVARSGLGLTSKEAAPNNYPIFMIRPANSFQASFSVTVNNKPGVTGKPYVLVDAPYATYGKIDGALGQYTGFDTGIVASIKIDGIVNANNLRSIGNAGVRAGELFLYMNAEWFSFESATNNGDGSWTLGNLHRALLDTVFVAHADNSDVWILGNNFSNVSKAPFPYPLGYTPQFGIVPNSVTKPGTDALALLTTDYSPASMRTLSPPRPHNTKVNGAARSSSPVTVTIGASTTVTWATRNRTSFNVELMLDVANNPENPDNTTASLQVHKIYHRSAGGAVTQIGTLAGYTGNTATFTMPSVALGAGSIYVLAETTMTGFAYQSINQDRISVNVV